MIQTSGTTTSEWPELIDTGWKYLDMGHDNCIVKVSIEERQCMFDNLPNTPEYRVMSLYCGCPKCSPTC